MFSYATWAFLSLIIGSHPGADATQIRLDASPGGTVASKTILAARMEDDRDPGDSTKPEPGTDETIDDSDGGGSAEFFQEIALHMVRTDRTPEQSGGLVRYRKSEAGAMLHVLVDGLSEGNYELTVGGIDRATFAVAISEEGKAVGEVAFSNPPDPKYLFLDFDPLGQSVEVWRENILYLAVDLPVDFDTPVDEDEIDVRVNLIGTGLAPEALGSAKYKEKVDRRSFEIRIGYLPSGNYDLVVNGVVVGLIAVDSIDITAKGALEFREPEEADYPLLDFDPRDASIEIVQNGGVYLTVPFPGKNLARPVAEVVEEFSEHGPLTPPSFIDETAMSLSDEGFLRLLLPDPNADGWDAMGAAQFEYVIKIEQDCKPVYDSIIVSGNETFPFLLETGLIAPDADYSVTIERIATLPASELASAPLSLNGPRADDQGVAMKLSDLDRWLLHAPKLSGGFNGRVDFVNLAPGFERKIYVAGFDVDGRLIEGSERSVRVIGVRRIMDIYGSNELGLFPTELTDLVSHIGLAEPGGGKTVSAAMTYLHHSSGAAGRSPEISLKDGVSGSRFYLYPTAQNGLGWDGLAILNLRGGSATHVYLSQYQLTVEGERLITTKLLGAVLPGGKLLYAVNEADFGPAPESFFIITSDQDSHKLQVLGLSGTDQVLSANPATKIR